MLINGEQTINFADMNENKTLYANPYMVINNKEYTKHYYTEGQRIASKIGEGLLPSIVPFDLQIKPITDDSYGEISDHLHKLCQLSDDCVGFYSEYANYGGKISCIKGLADIDNNERELFFFHSDHIGSSSFITDADGYASQHLQYLPFGEIFIEQRSTANYYTPYKFSGKEKDEETSYSYFGARYYMSDVSIWLSVDPMKDKYPNMSPYNYCALNPIRISDPDGRDIVITGESSDKTVEQMQTKNLKINRDSKSGLISYDGKPVTNKEKLLANTIKRKDITINITASKKNTTSTGENFEGGAYMGNKCKYDKDGKVTHVDAFQEINPDKLSNMDSKVNLPGNFVTHEIGEALEGASIAFKTGFSSPRDGQPGSTYETAHNLSSERWALGTLNTDVSIYRLPTSIILPFSKIEAKSFKVTHHYLSK